ncbi:MAG: glycosyltransferase family 2 protein [bacterium]|nr:glycosyltransferase family 2 protein [bacterium]
MMIGVVVVTYNSEQYIADCLRAVFDELGEQDACVVVVDNESWDGVVELVREGFPTVGVIDNPDNRGYSQAVNQGIRRCLERGCDLVLLLNPDTKMEKGSLAETIQVLMADEKRMIVQPLMTLMREPDRVNTWGNRYRGFGLVTVDGYGKRVAQGMVDRQIEYASGACMLVKASVFEQVGLFNERFFLYFEDTEFSQRARKAGGEIWLAANARVQHDYQRPLSPRKLGNFLRGWWRYFREGSLPSLLSSP